MKPLSSHRLILACLPIVLVGCTHLTNKSATLAIDSNPPGAEIRVMDKPYGSTPIRLPLATIFPSTYPPEYQHLYGKVHFSHPGCESLTLPVSNAAIESGLNGELECQKPEVMAVPINQPEGSAPQHHINKTHQERLLQLDELKHNGLISDTEYQTIRQRILDSL